MSDDVLTTTYKATKIVLSLCFTGIAASLIGIRLTPARGYEGSIYVGTPLFAWLFLIGSIAVGISIIVRQAFSPNKDNWWLGGFSLILLSSFIIIALPALRGYYYYNGADPFMHIEFTKYIQSSSHFWSEDIYPVMHILIAELSDVCNVSPIVIARYLPALVTVSGMVFTYLLARLAMSRGQALLVAAASAVLLFASAHISVYPHVTALMTLPLVFYLYFRIQQRPSASLKILFFTFLSIYPLLYPPVDLALIFFLIAAEVAKSVISTSNSSVPYFKMAKQFSVNPILIAIVALFLWISKSVLFGNNLQNLVNFLQGNLPRAPQIAVAEASLQGLGIGDMTIYILKMYSDIFVFGLLSLLAAIFITRRVIARDNTVTIPFSLVLIVAVAGPLHLFLLMTSPSISIGRVINANFMFWVLPLLAGYALFELFKRNRVSVQVKAVILVLLLSTVVSILGVYHSSYLLGPSWQVTYSDMAGTAWFVDYNESKDITHVLGYDLVSAAGALGYHEPGIGSSTKYTPSRRRPEVDIPEHFNYPRVPNVGALSKMREYLIINERFRVSSTDPAFAKGMVVPPILARQGFTQQDFDWLEADFSANKLYSNGGLEVWQTYPVR